MSGIDPSLLMGFYQVRLMQSTAQPNFASLGATAAAKKSATANEVTPWSLRPPADSAQDAKVLSLTNFFDTSKVPLTPGSTEDSQKHQDNEKLFALYTAVNNLSYLAKMSQREDMTSGQQIGLNARFQSGIDQIKDFLAATKFNNFSLQQATPSAFAVSSVSVPRASFNYNTRTLAGNAALSSPLPGVSASDSFTISIKKGATTTDVDIDLSQISVPLTLDNIISYTNQQLANGGFTTRLRKNVTQGSLAEPGKAFYGIQLTPGANETLTFSSAGATPSLYLAGNTGTATATKDGAADQQSRLIKLSDLDDPQSSLSTTTKPVNGNTTAEATQVDADGNVYVIGNATGDFANQLNQGTQDVYLSKYDSAGNLLWQRLVGSAGSASGYGLALNPTGGVVISGSTTAHLTDAAINDGEDSFVAKYDASGNQTWVKQIPTLAKNSAASVSVDASGNIYLGGQVSGGVIGAGQTSAGKADGYIVKLDSKGKTLYQTQFGTSGNDQVAATALTADGGLVVASVQNGHAILAKYANGDATTAPLWQEDLGGLQGGGIGGIAISGSDIYLSGTTQNASLNAGGAASVVGSASGNSDAFVFKFTDGGASVSADRVTYIGTSGTDKAGDVAVAADGTVYLTGSTMGTFAGQTRQTANVINMFATALNTDGTVKWTRQYSGVDGTSAGTGIAIDMKGSSVLDALGLPRGKLELTQSVDLTAQTTLRDGDSFQIKIEGAATRTATIRIERGETLASLARKINIQLQSAGKATVNYVAGGSGLKIAVNPGITATLINGPEDSDALARLGFPASKLVNTEKSVKTTNAGPMVFGLGLANNLDISNKIGAGSARAQLLNVLSAIRDAYQKSNAPAAAAAGPGKTGGTAPSYLTNQLASYNLALASFGGGTLV
jgi:hypothetical protein